MARHFKFMKLLNLLELLNILEQDYDHPWPNEDENTKAHREYMLQEIREQIKEIKDLRRVGRV